MSPRNPHPIPAPPRPPARKGLKLTLEQSKIDKAIKDFDRLTAAHKLYVTNFSSERARVVENKVSNCQGCGAPGKGNCKYCGGVDNGR
tara:strand:- start:2378 stop:2641 length:264 start_codon:yes stop_codon:yes gene_type:complete